jgi:hypothetical protein
MISLPAVICSVAMSLASHPLHSRHLLQLHTALAAAGAPILGAGHLSPPSIGQRPRGSLPNRQARTPPVPAPTVATALALAATLGGSRRGSPLDRALLSPRTPAGRVAAAHAWHCAVGRILHAARAPPVGPGASSSVCSSSLIASTGFPSGRLLAIAWVARQSHRPACCQLSPLLPISDPCRKDAWCRSWTANWRDGAPSLLMV